MNIRSINTGTPNQGDGESIRSAFTKVNDNFNTIENLLTSYNYQTPNTGTTITINDYTSTLVLEPGGTLAALTIEMPAIAENGFIQRICTTEAITSLTINPNTSQSILNAPTTLAAGSGVAYIYRSTNNTWYRLY